MIIDAILQMSPTRKRSVSLIMYNPKRNRAVPANCTIRVEPTFEAPPQIDLFKSF